MRLLVLDNYDSFTYNLVYILRELGYYPDVVRNDAIELEDVSRYDKILLSPGPGIPRDAGIMQSLIVEFAAQKSILGVCLGHQGIGEVFGARLENLGQVLHGVSHQAFVTDAADRLYHNLPNQITVGRYHSWSIVRASMPAHLCITAEDEQGRILSLAHRTYDVKGVQFHPESVLTQHGTQMIRNWLTV